jgi:hypothetical protein
MQRENPGHEMADMDWPAWTTPGIEHKLCAFIVEVKYSVKVAVAKENFSTPLKTELVSVCLYTY